MSEETFNRLLSWRIAFDRALTYLGIAEHLSNGAKTFETVEIAGLKIQVVLALQASFGLHEAALVLFQQVFGWGKEGLGIADNHAPEIQVVRDRMEQHAIQALGLPQDAYKHQMERITNQRHQQIAHYDGSKADYRRIDSSITAMKMPGCSLREGEVDFLAKVIRAMLQFVCQELRDAAPTVATTPTP